MKQRRLLSLLAIALLSANAVSAADINIVSPKVERLTNPIGIDATQPRFSWQITSAAKNVRQTAYRIVVASTAEKLAANEGDIWDSGTHRSDSSQYIGYQGKPLRSGMRYYWKVTVATNKGKGESKAAFWQMGLVDQNEWKAQWIGGKFASDVDSGHTKIKARYMRKEFAVDKTVKSATLYICGLGLYKAYVNGKKIGTQVLAPTPTNYDRSVRYNTFDITNEVRKGANAIGVIVGNGRFMAMRSPGMRGFGLPRLLAQIVITYADGNTATVATDATWKIMADGPIQENNEFDGEIYNTHKEMAGWNEAGYADSGWLNAAIVKAPAPIVCAQTNPNIRIMDTVKPKTIHATKDGRYIIDMGQNMVGWMRVKLHGNEGDTLRMRFAERLKGADSLYMANLRTAEVTDTYISNGKQRVWEPSFTYHGFRYVELLGFKQQPKVEDFEGKVVYDEMATTGSFSTSNNVINKIYNCAYWGIRGNYRGMPTDCPQRDERLGWLGDRATGALGECYIFDNQLLYSKWTRDIAETQRKDSVVCDIAPRYWSIYSDNLTWPMAWYNVAGMLYDQYGDNRSICENYDGMKKFLLHFYNRYSRKGILIHDTYGDWCMPPESPELIHSNDPSRITKNTVLSTAAFYKLCKDMIRYAHISGNDCDTTLWREKAIEAREAFNSRFFHSDKGYYDNNTITANILALRWGLVPQEHEQEVFAQVVKKMDDGGKSHISTGVLGTQEIMRGLTEYGRGDIAYKLATNTSYPSWGFMVEHGATTIWELWNGDTAEPKMNSGNHVMLLGDLVVWFYRYLAGIQQPTDSQGFKQITLKPYFIEGLDSVDASYNSIYGEIKSAWKRQGKKITYEFTIPANTSATVVLPSTASKVSKHRYYSGSYRIEFSL